MYFDSLNSGQDYRELPNVIAINIVDFDYLPGENFHTCFHLREDADPSIVLSPVLEIHFVNMVKWRKQGGKGLDDPLNRWLAWFDEESPPELIAEVASMDNAIMAANERQHFIIQNEEEYEEYWMRRKMEHDRISSLNGAREEGEEKKAFEIARNALTEGLPIEVIRKITGLDIETINGLQ
ncbi:MAG: Rpn family recombination-promoting nuclease/putative transposase [Treponema sp.]|nr:Rpn family recombination-promoting nuclease/putative transposase [Treponema sp.]